MSRTKPTDLEAIGVEIPCDYCNAIRGIWCTATAYKWAEMLHSVRRRPVERAFVLGLQDGRRSARTS